MRKKIINTNVRKYFLFEKKNTQKHVFLEKINAYKKQGLTFFDLVFTMEKKYGTKNIKYVFFLIIIM